MEPKSYPFCGGEAKLLHVKTIRNWHIRRIVTQKAWPLMRGKSEKKMTAFMKGSVNNVKKRTS